MKDIAKEQADKVLAFMEEREEQRRGCEGKGAAEEAKARLRETFPGADEGCIERAALCDMLMTASCEVETIAYLVESIYLTLGDYIEDAGRECPRQVEHVALCLDMLEGRCREVSDDVNEARRAASEFIRAA